MSARLGLSFGHSRRRHCASAGSFLAALFLATAAFGASGTQVLLDAHSTGCQGKEDRKSIDKAGPSYADGFVRAMADDCSGNTVHSVALGSADLFRGALRARAFGDHIGSDASATAALADLVQLMPVRGELGSIKFEFSGNLVGEDSGATYSFDASLPNGRFANLVTLSGSSTVAASYEREFVVPPEGWPMGVSVMVRASAGGVSSADLSRSAHIQLEGVEIVGSDSGVFLRDARPDIPGDANRDGVVNAQDVLIVRQNYGTSPAVFGTGDFNGDDRVGPDDLLILRRALANTRPGAIALPASDAAWLAARGADVAAPTSAVPEPAALGLLPLALALGRRRRASTPP